jgi:LPPG:FO 2-phospho-L-lactate transferase
MILALTGGTGGAKLIEGLASELGQSELTIICNTADDASFHGLDVSPDIDTIVYTLAGLVDSEKGWGLRGETFSVLEQLGRFGEDIWFKLGDKDLATHIFRTHLLRAGLTLSEVTRRICQGLGVQAEVLPMSDGRIETRVVTSKGQLSFQEYFVREQWLPEVTQIVFNGIKDSSPAPGVLDAIGSANGIILCPSNPVTSISPILSVPGVRRALAHSPSRIVGVSPIVGGLSFSGPAHKLMGIMGFEPSAIGVAQAYQDFLDVLVFANEDAMLKTQIDERGIEPVVTDVRMNTSADKRRLASEVLALLDD